MLLQVEIVLTAAKVHSPIPLFGHHNFHPLLQLEYLVEESAMESEERAVMKKKTKNDAGTVIERVHLTEVSR